MKRGRLFLVGLLMIVAMGFAYAGGADETTAADGTTSFELWTYVEAHSNFYKEMENIWNEENPDRKISLNITVLPNADMHNKLQMSLQSGYGAPDICDVHVNSFPNFMKGVPQFEDMTEAIAPYAADCVPSRLELYSKDGINYGVPFHVGACVMFYNTEILEEAGIDYTTIDTWDEFIEAGLIVKEKTGKYMTTAEGTRVNMLSAFLGEQGGDFVDENGVPNIVTEEMYNALEMEKRMIDLGISRVSPGGKPDSEECYGWINSGEVASLAFPLWFMSRFVDYMPDVAGKIAIAPMPRFEEGQDRSAGVGGTATVVINTAHDKDLAKEFVAWAKLSVEGGTKIWEILGFDPVNTKVWDDPAVTNDPDNKYLQYFVTNPFDTLREIRDEVNIIRSVEATPTISNYFNNQILLDVFENDADIMTTLENAQEEILNQLS